MSEQSPATVYLVDDDDSVRRALERLLRSAGFVVASFASAREFFHQQSPLAAGCILLDVTMPDVDGFTLYEWLSDAGNHLPVIFLTGDGDIRMGVGAIKSGASDFLTKPCDDEELLNAVTLALAQNAENRRSEADRRAVAGRFDRLTPREHEVMLGVVAGKLNKQIAIELGIAEKTVKIHRGRVMEKLEVDSIADLVRISDR